MVHGILPLIDFPANFNLHCVMTQSKWPQQKRDPQWQTVNNIYFMHSASKSTGNFHVMQTQSCQSDTICKALSTWLLTLWIISSVSDPKNEDPWKFQELYDVECRCDVAQFQDGSCYDQPLVYASPLCIFFFKSVQGRNWFEIKKNMG